MASFIFALPIPVKMNKLFFLLLLFAPHLIYAQNYFGKADSCLKLKDYTCAATNYDLALVHIDSTSNGIALRSAISWSLAQNKDKAFAAIRIYIRNNALNNYPFFSNEMEKEKGFDFLKSDPRWSQIISEVKKSEAAIRLKEKKKVDSAMSIQVALEKHNMVDRFKGFKTGDAKTLYKQIKNYNNFPVISAPYLSLQFRITDSLKMAFLVVLPKNYDAKRSYPVLFFLHGAVFYNTGYMEISDPRDTQGWNRYYTKYAGDVIMIYPHANKDYNWMYPDKGFYMVPAILRQVKQIVNVDDNKVFISGHSNGATGSFSYLMKQQSPFAGFYGFNTRPRVETGGTYIRNISNRSYFNVSTDQDYYYPPGANNTLDAVMKSIRADYQDHRYNGFPHWFPQFDESEPVYKLLFTDLSKRQRNPFHTKIYWECDGVKYGACDWLQITALDTTVQRAKWHKDINFGIHKWLMLDDKSKVHERDTLVKAFRFRRKSGAVKASYTNNTFIVETSDVRSFSLLISPEMVDMTKPVSIIVNGQLYRKEKFEYDKDFILTGFENTADRKAVWVNHMDVTLP